MRVCMFVIARYVCMCTVWLPDPSDWKVPIGAAGGWAGTGVVDVGHQGVGWGADHGLQVNAGIWQWGDRQRPLPAQSGCQPWARETWYWIQTHKDTIETMSAKSALIAEWTISKEINYLLTNVLYDVLCLLLSTFKILLSWLTVIQNGELMCECIILAAWPQ